MSATLISCCSRPINSIESPTPTIPPNHGKIETCTATGQKPLDDIGAAKPYAQLVAGHSRFRYHDFRFADPKSVPDIDGFLKQSLGCKIFSEHSPGQIHSRQFSSPIAVVLRRIRVNRFSNTAVNSEIGLLITFQIQRTQHHRAFDRLLENSRPDELALPAYFLRHSDVH